MPTLDGATTKDSKAVWKSPDGQRTISEVVLDYQGTTFKAKTYSNDIATVGWTGTIESYEKEGRQGSETFVKQPPKENQGYPTAGGRSGGSYQRDDSHIKAQWAIGQSIIVHNAEVDLNAVDLDSVQSLARELYDMVDRVRGESAGADTEPATDEVVSDVTKQEDLLKDIDEVFGKSAPETPWKKS